MGVWAKCFTLSLNFLYSTMFVQGIILEYISIPEFHLVLYSSLLLALLGLESHVIEKVTNFVSDILWMSTRESPLIYTHIPLVVAAGHN